jgi:prepilin-type N-terminal cleavage/methylation domain-containing protein
MRKQSGFSGFTLIELLIVFVIVGLLTSLVAPIGSKQVRQAEAQAERLELQRILDMAAFEAYSHGSAIELSANGSIIDLKFSTGKYRQLKFEQLSFSPRQVIYINSNGVASASELIVMQAGRPATFRLNRWLDDAV